MNNDSKSEISPETKQMERSRLILHSIECGIKKHSIGFSMNKFKEILDENYHDGNVAMLSDRIYHAGQNWANKGVCILVDGGESGSREIFGGACLFRFIASNAYLPGELVMNIRMSETIINLSTFDQSRFEMAKKMSEVPCLLIQEVDLREHPRDTNDCIMLLDSILFNRIRHNKPTIFTLSQTRDEFGSPAIFGKIFRDVIASRNINEVWNIRLVTT